MRTKNAIKNSIYSVGSFSILVLIGFVSRKLFLQYLSLDFLGYEGLFANVFSLLSLAEMGTASVIIYGLYEAVAKQKKHEIAKLMQIYKIAYRVIGTVVLFLGIIISFFIPQMLKGNVYELNVVTAIYFLQLTSTMCTYFLAYKRMLFIAEQKVFECIKVDTAIDVTSKIIRLFVIAIFKNYILYQLVNVIGIIISNAIISRKYNKNYQFIKEENIKVTWADFKSLNFFKDIKNALATQISGTVYGATDNIVISTFLSIRYVGLVSNYLFVIVNIGSVIRKIFEPLTASIANQIRSDDVTNTKKMFFMFNWISFLIASFVATSYMVMFQPFIELAFGAKYLLPFSYVVALSIESYIGFCAYFLSLYRVAFGRFELDRNFALAGAVVNIVVSVILVRHIGIAGVVVGTAIGQFFFWMGRLRVVYTELIQEKVLHYVFKEIKWFVLFLIELGATFAISDLYSNFIFKLVVCAIIPNLINYIVFRKSEEFKLAQKHFGKVFYILKNRTKENKTPE